MNEEKIPFLDNYLKENKNNISLMVKEDVNLTSIEKINEYLISANSYEEKIEVIEKEKNKVKNLINYLEYSEKVFKEESDYLYNMQDIYDNTVNILKRQIPLDISLMILSTSLSILYTNLIKEYGFEFMLSIPLLSFILTLHGYFIYYTYDMMNNIVNAIEYKEEIDDYKRVLTKKD